MHQTSRWVVSLTALVSGSALACGGSSDGGTGPQTPIIATVHEIQTGVVSTGKNVVLTNVIITGVSTDESRVWVADDPHAAPSSGIEVYRGSNPPALGAAFGYRIKVAGKVQEFGEGSGGTITQIANPSITVLNTVPGVSYPLDDVTLETLAEDATAEPYEGVQVSLHNVAMTSASPLRLGDGTASLGVGAQMGFPAPAIGTCYDRFDGIVTYDVIADAWIIVSYPAGALLGSSCN